MSENAAKMLDRANIVWLTQFTNSLPRYSSQGTSAIGLYSSCLVKCGLDRKDKITFWLVFGNTKYFVNFMICCYLFSNKFNNLKIIL